MVPERIRRILTAYVDGELEARQNKAVGRLLRRSSEARELLRGLQEDATRLGSLPRPTLGPEFSDQILHTIASRKIEWARHSALTIHSRIPAWLGLATAAAVLLVAGLGYYLYLVGVDRQQQAQRLALQQFPSEPPELPRDPVAESAPPKSGTPEILSTLPRPESTVPGPLPVELARTKDPKPPSEPKPSRVLGSPLRDNTDRLNDPEDRIALAFQLRDLDARKQEQLHKELRKGTAHAMDLRCTNAVAGMERLQNGFKAHGIQLVLDPDALAALKLGMGRTTSFAFYFEDVTAEELIAVLQGLGREEPIAEPKRGGANRFDSLVLNAMPREERHRLWRLFGMDPARFEAPAAKAPAAADFRKSSTPGKEEDAAPAVAAKSQRKTLDRWALVRAYPSGRPKPISTELKRYLDKRGEPRPGSLQVLLLLGTTKN